MLDWKKYESPRGVMIGVLAIGSKIRGFKRGRGDGL
jgi:hypothetical protein